MISSRTTPWLVAVVLLFVFVSAEDDGLRRMDELRQLTQKSSNGIIKFDPRQFQYVGVHSDNTLWGIPDRTT